MATQEGDKTFLFSFQRSILPGAKKDLLAYWPVLHSSVSFLGKLKV